MSQLLSQNDTAKAIGVSALTLITWRDKGIITPVIKEGYVIRYDIDEVKQILAERAKAKVKA